MKKNLSNVIYVIFSLTIFIVAVTIIYQLLREYNYHQIINHIKQIPFQSFLQAMLFAFLSYFALTLYETLAVKYASVQIEYPKIALTSFISDALGNSFGLPFIAGGATQYNLYSNWGLRAYEISKIVTFYALTFWLGFCTLSGIIFLLEPLSIPPLLHFPFSSAKPLAYILILLVTSYLIAGLLVKKHLRLFGFDFYLPSFWFMIAVIIVSSMDWIFCARILYSFLPQTTNLTFLSFLEIYLLAEIAGIISRTPSGIGVFELVLILFLAPIMPPYKIIGSALSFRLVYNVIPLLIAITFYAIYSLNRKKISNC